MKNNDCILCKCVSGEILVAKIFEDDNFVAFLDVKPATEGMTLVIPKNHYTSDVFKNDQDLINGLVSVSKKVSDMLRKYFNPERIALLFEGIEIDHLHAKLYPLKAGQNMENMLPPRLGIQDMEDLKILAEDIVNSYNK